MAARTDIHREGAFVPADYEPVFPFSLFHTVDGWPVPAWNIDLIVLLRREKAVFGPVGHPSDATNACSVCGAYFIHGEVWRHEATGEYITLGHTCAAKYEMFAEWDDYRRAKATHIAEAIKTAERKADRLEWLPMARELLAANPGLNAELKLDHEIVRDIRARVIEKGVLSEKALALVRKLANPPPKAPVPVTEKRIEIEGEVVSYKDHYADDFGFERWVMTVKVATEAGEFLVWGSVPKVLIEKAVEIMEERRDGLIAENRAKREEIFARDVPDAEKVRACEAEIPTWDDANSTATLKGDTVRFMAKVKPSDNDPSFGFFSRPTKAALVA
jgi:hypothetical protein